MGPNGPMMGPPPGMMGGMPPMGDNMMRMPPGPVPYKQGMPMVPPPMGGMIPPNSKVDSKVKISNLLRDKQRLLDMETNTAKRALMEPLKIIAEEEGADPNIRHLSTHHSIQTPSSLINPSRNSTDISRRQNPSRSPSRESNKPKTDYCPNDKNKKPILNTFSYHFRGKEDALMRIIKY